MSDRAPTVFDSNGNPMKVRLVEGECKGEVSGEGHYGYHMSAGADAENVTLYFERCDG